MKKKPYLFVFGLLLASLVYLATNVAIYQRENDRSIVDIESGTEKKILFYKEDCTECQQVFRQYYWHDFVYDDVLFVNLNQAKNRHYISRYQLTSVPTMVFKNTSYAGIDAKKIEQLLNQE